MRKINYDNQKKPIGVKLKQAFLDSYFVKLSMLFANFIQHMVENSWTYNFFTTYKNLEHYAKRSMFYRICVLLPQKAFKKLRLFFAQLVEESIASRLTGNFFQWILSLGMISWGAFLITFGASIVASMLYVFFQDATQPFLNANDVLGFGLLIVGLFFTTSRESLSVTILNSRFFRFLLFDVLGLREVDFRVQKNSEQIFLLGFLGIPCGLLSILVSPLYLLFAFCVLVGLLVIFVVPETGFVLLLCVLPFIDTIPAAGIAGVTVFAFLFKAVRCKRVLRFQLVDIFVLFFMTIMFVMGGATALYPLDSLKSVALYLIFISIYFVGANGIRNEKLMNKSIIALVLGGVASSLIGIYQYFFSSAGAETWLDSELFNEISLRVVGPFENPNVFGEYLIMILPLCVALIFMLRGKHKIMGFMASALMFVALVYTWSRGAWLAFAISILLFFLFYKGIALKLVFPGLCALPFLPAVIPDSIMSRVLSIGNVADSSTSYRVSIWIASLRMVQDIYKTGIGVGLRAFTAIYPAYALSGVAYAPHSHNLYLQIIIDLGIMGLICFVVLIVLFYKLVFATYKDMEHSFYKTAILALGLGVLGILVQGMTDYVWYNYRIFLMFWMMLGLTVGFTRGYFLDKKYAEEVREYE